MILTLFCIFRESNFSSLLSIKIIAMKLFFSILAILFFYKASAQSLSAQPKSDFEPATYVDVNFDGNYNPRNGDFLISDDATNQSGFNTIILNSYNILWVFNDVGNNNTHRSTITGSEMKSPAASPARSRMRSH
jgi:hypothetical protein